MERTAAKKGEQWCINSNKGGGRVQRRYAKEVGVALNKDNSLSSLTQGASRFIRQAVRSVSSLKVDGVYK